MAAEPDRAGTGGLDSAGLAAGCPGLADSRLPARGSNSRSSGALTARSHSSELHGSRSQSPVPSDMPAVFRLIRVLQMEEASLCARHDGHTSGDLSATPSMSVSSLDQSPGIGCKPCVYQGSRRLWSQDEFCLHRHYSIGCCLATSSVIQKSLYGRIQEA